jgi:hypothetical protein
MSPDTWLVFNECEHEHQCNTPPEEAARFYHDEVAPVAYELDPAARLIVGGVNAGACGLAWLERFVEFYRLNYGDVPRAGWHFHIYPEVWAGPGCAYPWGWNWAVIQDVDLFWSEWLYQAENVRRFMLRYGREGEEAWITESGCLSPAPSICPEQAYTIAARSLAYYDGDGRFITRYAWFADGGPGLPGSWYWTNLWIGTHETSLALQPLGELWLRHEPLPAVPLTIYRRWFPIVGYGADVAPQPRPTVPAVTPVPYPAPEGLHP